MIWSKQKYKMNYFVDYKEVNKMREEFTNEIFKEDLLELYKEKDITRKGIITDNKFLQEIKNVSTNKKFIKDILQYEKDFNDKKILKHNISNKKIKLVVDDLIKIKSLLKQTSGSIKYQYLKKYPNIINEVDNLSKKIIELSLECQEQVEKYIQIKQDIVSYKYQNEEKIKQAQTIEKEKAEQEILKLIGNQILNFERILLNQKLEYNQIQYINNGRQLIWNIFNMLYFKTRQEEKYLRRFELIYKKQLSKQAKKELALKKRNESSLNWEK